MIIKVFRIYLIGEGEGLIGGTWLIRTVSEEFQTDITTQPVVRSVYSLIPRVRGKKEKGPFPNSPPTSSISIIIVITFNYAQIT